MFFCRSELDIDSKKWRLRADLLNDIAMMVEIFVLPFYPKYALAILSLTTTMKGELIYFFMLTMDN